MSDRIDIKNPAEVSKALRDNTASIMQYVECLQDDLKLVNKTSSIVEKTILSVNNKKLERQRVLDQAKAYSEQSPGAMQTIQACQRDIAICDRGLHQLNHYKSQVESISNEIMRHGRTMQDYSDMHKTVQQKLCYLINEIINVK